MQIGVQIQRIQLQVRDKAPWQQLGRSLHSGFGQNRGKLFPFGWFPLVKSLFFKHDDGAELLLVGVKPEFRNSGVNSLIFADVYKNLNSLGVKWAETNAILETNTKNQSQFTLFEHEQKKRRRSYIKELEY